MPEGYELPMIRSGNRIAVTIPRVKYHVALRFVALGGAGAERVNVPGHEDRT